MSSCFSRLFRHFASDLQISPAQVWQLLVPFNRSLYARRYAAALIIARIQLISFIFAVIVPLWSIVDLMTFEAPLSWQLTLLRLASGLMLLILGWPRRLSEARPYTHAMIMLLALMLLPSVFYVASMILLNSSSTVGIQAVMTQFYIFIPIVVLAGLAIFPLSATEIILLSLPAFITAIGGFFIDDIRITFEEHFIVIWCMAMMICVSIFSGISQLHYMEAMLHRAMTDPLTGTASRRSGMETLRLLFHLSAASGKPLSVAFFDIDHFKHINDAFGHDTGDHVLQQITERLRSLLRHSDTLVRWGGEEFLAILPDIPAHQLTVLVERLTATGLGTSPDGAPLTASVGIAETMADRTESWRALVELADKRMYEAKRQGRARALLPGNIVVNLNPAAKVL
ncbi:MAG: GGDEF domain-containing protein [Azoarcus sp.]|jgi:diguanylate cyclase (GGDEF)-like protein|nr:GGDEF domain-containing protein [Azoarcus sp.]